jgi:uncharacterized membrane protein YqjE
MLIPVYSWFKKNQPIVHLFYFIVGIYLSFYREINNTFSNLFTNTLTKLLSINLTVGRLLIITLSYLIIVFIWKYFRNREIRIIKATYYSSADTSKQIDITKRIQSFIKQNIFTFQVSNILAVSDPQYGVPKKLDLEYKIGKNKRKETYLEWEIIDLINPTERPTPLTVS